jgi:hypothetical protein
MFFLLYLTKYCFSSKITENYVRGYSMSDLKFFLLDALYHSPHRQESTVNLINRNPARATLIGYALKELEEASFIKPITCSDKVELTPKGANTYEAEKEVRYNQACEERQQSFDNKISIASILIPLVTFFIGIIVEACTNITQIIFSLF